MTTADPVGRRIVVGVDGSETSRDALRWAAGEAAVHDAELHVVYAWDVTPPGVGIGSAISNLAGAPDDQRGAAERVLAQMIEEELGAQAPANLQTAVSRGSATSVLLEAAQGADLLVVGSRGLGGFAGLLLGSVSMKLAHHAGCPVVIVRPVTAQDKT